MQNKPKAITFFLRIKFYATHNVTRQKVSLRKNLSLTRSDHPTHPSTQRTNNKSRAAPFKPGNALAVVGAGHLGKCILKYGSLETPCHVASFGVPRRWNMSRRISYSVDAGQRRSLRKRSNDVCMSVSSKNNILTDRQSISANIHPIDQTSIAGE